MRLHIVRHGDPDYQTDDLTVLGHAEAEALAGRMAGLPLVKLYSSPLGRARATAKHTADRVGLPVEILGWAGEPGHLQAPRDADAASERVVAWDILPHRILAEEKARGAGTLPGLFPAPQTDAFMTEVRAGWTALLAEWGVRQTEEGLVAEGRLHRNDVALFCHNGLGLALLSIIVGLPLSAMWRAFCVAPTSVTTVLLEQYAQNRINPRVLCVGDTGHLAGTPLCGNTSGLQYNTR